VWHCELESCESGYGSLRDYTESISWEADSRSTSR